MCLDVGIHSLSYFVFVKLLRCLNLSFSSNLGHVWMLAHQIFFLPLFLSTPFWSPTMHMLVCLIVSQGFWGSVHLTPLIFHSCLQTESSQLIYFQFHAFFSSACLNLLLSSCSEFSILFVILSNSRISIWFFFIISTYCYSLFSETLFSLSLIL